MKLKPFVVYYSKTGNTKKIAQAIAKVLGTETRSVKEVKEVPEDAFIIAGSGTYANKAGKQMIEFLERLPPMKGKKAAVFGTSGAGRFEESGGLNRMKQILEEKGAKPVGTFCCQGSSFYMFNRGHPNEEEMENARKFAKSLFI
jgi:flavodoxin